MGESDHAALIARFYDAFRNLDSDAMQASYAPDAGFEDPVFSLQGREPIGAMWRMLCEAIRHKGLAAWRLDVRDISADSDSGRAHWEPHYRFSATGRLVHNVVDAAFTFRNGLIETHRDTFDFWRWSRQALGPAGLLVGWTPYLRGKVRAQAAGNLAKFTHVRHEASGHG